LEEEEEEVNIANDCVFFHNFYHSVLLACG